MKKRTAYNKEKKELSKAKHAAAFIKEFRRVRRLMQAELKKRDISYTEEDIFKMVS